jgi:DNA invertase Pin-like site-specific DNA recombinase
MVGYYRVSTAERGRSGLGLEAQEATVRAYVAAHGCDLIAAYSEVETGKRDSLANRPELRKAIAHAKRLKATLVIAKLDRLARSVYVTAELHRSGIDFVACDNPTANRTTVQILAAVAENEVRQISERTRAALGALKARGVPLGASRPRSRNLTAEARSRGALQGASAARRAADEAYIDVVPLVRQLKCGGASLRQIAAALNEDGHTTRRGKPWNAVQVGRVLSRASMP